MFKPVLYRERFIPKELHLLNDDIILRCDEVLIVTSWKAFKEKPYLSYGQSCYYLKKGYKVSKFYTPTGEFHCWYCDIVTYTYKEESNSLIVSDLLADVVIYPSGEMRVLDLDELVEAHNKGLIDTDLLKKSLLSLNRLLSDIHTCGIDVLGRPIDDALHQ
ncbi:MAG: DUF402 domain-containing protein [Butyrivibrio sp.]|jgi:protein associated with RNAse G/E|nr:DUF402 domain-containing protein [Butyrivibrio sp.]